MRRVPTLAAVLLLLACVAAGVRAADAPPVEPPAPSAPTPTADLPRRTIDLGDGVSFEMVLIPAGEFDMGSTEAERVDARRGLAEHVRRMFRADESLANSIAQSEFRDEPLHRVRLTRPYWLATTETTQAVWKRVMGELPPNPGPWVLLPGTGRPDPDWPVGAAFPVSGASWHDCQAFLSALNSRVPNGAPFRLPTEAEWEHACRAGSSAAYAFGGDGRELSEHAWYAANSELAPHPVSRLKPNAWGLFDVHGNLSEWCSDVYASWTTPETGVAEDPVGPDPDARALRGGAWWNAAPYLRSASRAGPPGRTRATTIGFRIARTATDVESHDEEAAAGALALRFALDLSAARREKRIAADERDRDVLASTARVVADRLVRYGLRSTRLLLLGDDRFEVVVPPGVDAECVKRLVTVTGDVQFRIEVQPLYPEFIGDRGERRARDRVWTGASGRAATLGAAPETYDDTADGFEKFKAREVERWTQARQRGEAYVPLDPRWRLVAVQNSARASAADFVVVEEPANPEQRLGGGILTNIRPGPDSRGDPKGGVHMDVKPEYQDVLQSWTGANVGLPMAILLNGEYHSAPVINGPLKDAILVSLGHSFVRASPEQDRLLGEAQEQLVAVLQAGALRLAPRFESQRLIGAGER